MVKIDGSELFDVAGVLAQLAQYYIVPASVLASQNPVHSTGALARRLADPIVVALLFETGACGRRLKTRDMAR